MAFGNFWRGDRERPDERRERERYRGRGGGDWRNEDREREWRGQGRERAHGRDYEERQYGQGWSPGGEYYSDRSRGHGAQGDWTPGREDWRGQGRGYGEEYGQRRWRGEGRSWEENRAGSEGRGWGDEEGRYSGERDDYGEQSTIGYGGGRSSEYARPGAPGFGGIEGERRPGEYGYGAQQYRGRGPRGYQRSDERIREDLCDALTDDPQIDASNMEVTVKDREVTLTGSVDSREAKRRAEDLAESISGVKDVHNSLRVTAGQQGAGAAQQGTTSSPMSQTSRH